MPSYRKNLTLRLGPVLAVTGSLYTVRPSERSTALKSLCPEHFTPLQAPYRCPAADHIVERHQAVKGRQTPQGWAVVRPDDAPSFPADDSLSLTPVPISEVTSHTFEGHGAYYFTPAKGFDDLWLILKTLVTSKEYVLVTKGALRRGGRNLYKLTLFNDYLVLRQLEFPEQVSEPPAALPKPSVSRKVMTDTVRLSKDMMNSLAIAWTKFDAKNDYIAAFEGWLEQATIQPGTPPAESPTTSNIETLHNNLKKDMKERKSA